MGGWVGPPITGFLREEGPSGDLGYFPAWLHMRPSVSHPYLRGLLDFDSRPNF